VKAAKMAAKAAAAAYRRQWRESWHKKAKYQWHKWLAAAGND
jgi:hypothetical protein